MMRRWIFALLIGLALTPTHAQDALNLPTELYILQNSGSIERYGLGTSGVRRVTPSEAFVLDFRVGPDGNWLAYRTQDGLYLSSMFGAEGNRLLNGEADVPALRARGETLAWSPDGDALAYTTLTSAIVHFMDDDRRLSLPNAGLFDLLWSPDGRYLALGAEQNVWWIYRREGREMVLTSAITSGTSATWFDLTQMAFTPAEGGLILMDMAQGNRQTLLLDDFSRYSLPYAVADGSLLVYRLEDDGQNGTLLRLGFEAEGFTVVEIGLAPVPLAGARWAPGAELLVAYEGGVLALINPITGSGFTLPITGIAAYGWGPLYPPAATGLSLPRPVNFIAPNAEGVRQVWRMTGDGTPPVLVTVAGVDVTEYAFSPDNRRIVYVSNSGLWEFLLDGSAEPREVVRLARNEPVWPAFSPDGVRIYYRDETDDQPGIWVADLESDAVAPFLPDEGPLRWKQPRPASGVNALVVQASGEEAWYWVDAVSGERQLLGAYADARWLSGTEVLVQGVRPVDGAPVDGLHLVDVNNLAEPPFTLLAFQPGWQLLDVAPNGDDLRVLIRQRPTGPVTVIDAPRRGGQAAVLSRNLFLAEPRIAAESQIVLGQRYPGGPLIAVNLLTQSQVRLNSFDDTQAVQWR